MLTLFSPRFFYKFSKALIPFLWLLMLVLIGIGLYYSLMVSPPDYQQGEMVRVMYVHVPSAWMSLGIYTFIALCSLSCLVWKTRLSYILAVSAAPIGATFSLITLATGSIWGKPIWGTWWVFDARLTSMLVLFLLYLSYIAIVNSGNDILRAEKPASVMALIGFVNVPIVKFSVDIWYSLHQPASVLKMTGPSIHPSMMMPLMVMFFGFIIYFLLLLLIRVNSLMLKIKGKNNR